MYSIPVNSFVIAIYIPRNRNHNFIIYVSCSMYITQRNSIQVFHFL